MTLTLEQKKESLRHFRDLVLAERCRWRDLVFHTTDEEVFVLMRHGEIPAPRPGHFLITDDRYPGRVLNANLDDIERLLRHG